MGIRLGCHHARTANILGGFAPGSAAEIPIDEAYEKLRNEAEAARILREKYG